MLVFDKIKVHVQCYSIIKFYTNIINISYTELGNSTFIDYMIDNNNIHMFEKQALKNLRWKYVECNTIKQNSKTFLASIS